MKKTLIILALFLATLSFAKLPVIVSIVPQKTFTEAIGGDLVNVTVMVQPGEFAALDGPDWRAKQGHIAEVMGRNVAVNIDAMVKGSEKRESYIHHLNILCVMDGGNGASFVFRNDKGGKMIPLPIVGHWLKKGWGWYCRNSKLGKIPRIPGM